MVVLNKVQQPGTIEVSPYICLLRCNCKTLEYSYCNSGNSGRYIIYSSWVLGRRCLILCLRIRQVLGTWIVLRSSVDIWKYKERILWGSLFLNFVLRPEDAKFLCTQDRLHLDFLPVPSLLYLPLPSLTSLPPKHLSRSFLWSSWIPSFCH